MFRPIVSFYRVISIRVLVCIHDRPDWFSTTSAFERIRRTRTRSRRAGRTFSFVTTVSLRDLIEGLTRSSFANRNGQIEATYEAEYRFSCAIYYSVIIDIVVNKLFFILAIGYFIESRVPIRPSIRVFQIVYRCFSRSASLFRRSFFFRIVSQIILDRSNGDQLPNVFRLLIFHRHHPVYPVCILEQTFLFLRHEKNVIVAFIPSRIVPWRESSYGYVRRKGEWKEPRMKSMFKKVDPWSHKRALKRNGKTLRIYVLYTGKRKKYFNLVR